MAEAKAPRVSVVIPCYNGGADLPAALDSLDDQTFRDFETVVVDDGSTDPPTIDLLARLGGRARLVRQPNRGLPAARNAGIAAVRGGLVLPLDCDDRLKPDFLAHPVAALDAVPEAAFAFTWIDLAGERRGVLAQHYNLFTQLFLNKVPYALLIRRTAWETVGGYDETLRQGYEDWEFNIRLGARGFAGVEVSAPLFVYRISTGGMLQSLSNRRRAQLWRDIQTRHPDLYRLRALIALWARWRDRPGFLPGGLLLPLLAAHRLLPDVWFNALFARLLRFAASARTAEG
jgi:glycosyltransferase involved in cell wall biosynthesis